MEQLRPVTRRRPLLLLLPLALSICCSQAQVQAQTLLHKCCPAGQQLSADLKQCVDAGMKEGGGSVAGEGGEVTLPWWLNSNTLFYDFANPSAKVTPPALRFQLGPRPPCSDLKFKYFTSNSNSRYRMLSNGSLLLRTDDVPKTEIPRLMLSPEEFCADRVVQNNHVAHVFLACPCAHVACVFKCCPLRSELHLDVFRKTVKPDCKVRPKDQPMWTPSFFDSPAANATALYDVPYITLDSKVPTCNANEEWVVLNMDRGTDPLQVRVLANGSAMLENYGGGTAFDPTAWCGDGSVVSGSGGDATCVDNALACSRKVAQLRRPPLSNLLYGSLFVVSAACLALTLLVHALLPDLRRSAHAKALICHVAALFAGSLALATAQLKGVVSDRRRCFALAFTIQYSMLATFFWLNVMCYDVAWTFRKIRPAAGKGRGNRRFLMYSLYAWGAPAVITAFTAIMDFVEGIPNYLIKPNIGVQDCWLLGLPALFAYFYGPVAALLLANAILYGCTARRLVHARRETAMVDTAGAAPLGTTSTLGAPRQRAVLHLKLFLLMGITWVMEVVSVVVGQNDAYWYLSDGVNILRGVFLFVVVCCKRDVLLRLRTRLRELFGKAKGMCAGTVGPTSSNSAIKMCHLTIKEEPRRRSSGDTTTTSAGTNAST